MTPRQAIPADWTDRLEKGVPTSLGHDVGTTTKGTSNPSALAVAQQISPRISIRFTLVWKTSDDAVSRQMLRIACEDIARAGIQPRALVIDNSSEKFFATSVRRDLMGLCPVRFVSGNQKLKHRGEEMDAKTLLGNLYANAIEDGLVELAPDDWLSADHRLVHREGGGFTTATGKWGEHGDTFDAGKLACWPFWNRSASVAGVHGMQVGEYGVSKGTRPGIKNKLWVRARRANTHLT